MKPRNHPFCDLCDLLFKKCIRILLFGSPAADLDDEAVEDDGFGEGAGDKGAIGFGAGEVGGLELLHFEAARVGGGDAEGIGAESAVLFSRQVGGGLFGELFESSGEKLRLAGDRNAVAVHEILHQEEIADRGDDGSEEDADGAFVLTEKLVERVEAETEVSFGDGVAQVEDPAGPGGRHEAADVVVGNLVIIGEREAELIEFDLDLPGFRPDSGGQDGRGVGGEAEASRGYFLLHPFDDVGLGGTPTEGGFVVDSCGGEFGEFLVGSAAFVGFGSTEEEGDVGGNAFFENFEESVDRGGDGVRAAGDAVSKERGVLEPDEFGSAEEGDGEKAFDGLRDALGSSVGVGVGSVDGVDRERIVRGRELGGEFRGGLFDGGFVRAGDEVNRFLIFGFRFSIGHGS